MAKAIGASALCALDIEFSRMSLIETREMLSLRTRTLSTSAYLGVHI